MSFRIVVMAKAPIPGTVKTRLGLAPKDAARLQTALIQDTTQKARAIAPTTVAGAPAGRLELIRALLPHDVAVIPQQRGDLGHRMLSAARALDSHDVSIIQSTDGGYVLLGLRRRVEDVFAGVEWSTEAVYEQTLRRAGDAGLSVHESVPWYDVDEPDDLARLREELDARPGLAPLTSAVSGARRLRGCGRLSAAKVAM